MMDCRTSNVDLLIVFENYGSEFCINQENNREFITEVLDVFLAPEEENLTRLHVAVASFTSSGPVMYLPFQNGSRRGFMQEIDKLDSCHSNESPLDVESAILDLHNSVNTSFQESHGKRVNAKDIVIFMSNLTDTNEYVAVGDLYYEFCEECYDIFSVIVSEYHDESYVSLLSSFLVVVTPVSYIGLSPVFPHAVCNQCGKEWFTTGREKNENEPAVCYYLDRREYFASWWTSMYYCENRDGSMATVHKKEDISPLNVEIQKQLQYYNLDSSQILSIRNYFYLYVYMDVQVSQTNIIKNQHDSDADFASQTNRNWHTDHLHRCGAWLLKIPAQSQIFDEAEGRLMLQMNRSITSNQYKPVYVEVPCYREFSTFTLCQYPPYKTFTDTSTTTDMVPKEANETSITNALNRGEYVKSPRTNETLSISLEVHQTNGHLPDYLANINPINLVFSCSSKNHRIPLSFVCDHYQSCPDNGDEDICEYRPCEISEFQCVSSSRCIPIEAACDLFEDCEDGSDEQYCTRLYTCVGHVCGLGQCIPKHWVGDGHIDCSESDEDDENNDESISAVSALNQLERCAFLCNRTQCVYPSQLNDGVVDCQGPEGPLDETLGALQHVSKCRRTNVYRPNAIEWAPLCVYIRDRYGTLLGCRDGSHLQDCANFTCPEGYVKCPESYCIPTHYLNNRQLDCPRGDDEEVPSSLTVGGYFSCPYLLHPDRICDGHDDCSDGVDELNCHVSCAAGFMCLMGMVTAGDYDKTIPLTSLDFIDDRTRYVDLSGVNVSYSVSSSGTSAQLNNLVYLLLANCSISDVGYEFVNAIGRVSSIYWMNLSYNDIHEITNMSAFRWTKNLRVLDLSHNKKLAVLDQWAFDGSIRLEKVDLSYTSIYRLHVSSFHGLNSLNLLNLSHTLINSLVGKNFPDTMLIDTLDLRGTLIKSFERDTFDGLTVASDLYADVFSLCCPDVRGAAIPEHTCHAPRDSISSCADLIGDQVQRILLWVVGIIALLCNTLVIVYRFVWDTENIKRPYGLFVTNLGISDFIMGVYLVIIAGADAVYRDVYVWNDREWRYGVTCKIAGFLSTLSSETSMLFILLVTLDRLLVIRFPFGEHRISEFGKILLTVGAWMIGIVLSMIPLLPIFDEDNIYTSNGLCLGLPLTNERPDGWGFSMGVFIVFNFTIFLVIAIGQFLIYRAMSSHRSAIAQSSARRAQDIEVAKTLFLVVLSDFLCWFPIGVMGLSALNGKEIGREAYAWSAVLVLPVNSALNPLLYTIPIVMAKWKTFKHG